ncbi:MAG: hypothetical protein JNK09_02465 [Prolixibacteraceae bacterium]|nr:hypothetical protein [Prolixibacteraceae bacterium]
MNTPKSYIEAKLKTILVLPFFILMSTPVCLGQLPPIKIPVVLKVNNDTVLMDNFLGVNGVYHGFAYMPEQIKKGMNENDRQREFSRVKNMDLKIARTWYRADWACGNNMYNDFDWETEKMKAFYLWLDRMKELKVDVAIQAGWWFTKDTYFHVPEKDGKDTIGPKPDKDPERFALWIKESLHQLIQVKGYTNIKYLILFTEPLNYPAGIIPAGYTEPEYYDKVCTQIHEKLVESGLRSSLKLVGPNSGSTDTAAWVGWSVRNLDKVIDIYSWHAYNGGKWNSNPPLEYDGWKNVVDVGRNKMKQTGKPFWIDEYGANRPDESLRFRADYGNYLAQCVAAFTNGGAQTSLIWLMFDQQYVAPGETTTNKDSFHNGVHRWGVVKWPHDDVAEPENPYPSWYAFSMMSKYLGGRNNTKVYKTTNADSVYVVATQPNSGEISVMVVNASHTSRKVKVDFQNKINGSLNRHLYDPAKVVVSKEAVIPGTDKKIKIAKYSFSDELPSRGVAIYTTLK